jgi:hypothetical protein
VPVATVDRVAERQVDQVAEAEQPIKVLLAVDFLVVRLDQVAVAQDQSAATQTAVAATVVQAYQHQLQDHQLHTPVVAAQGTSMAQYRKQAAQHHLAVARVVTIQSVQLERQTVAAVAAADQSQLQSNIAAATADRA